MPNQLLKGRTFSPGDTVDADDLNNLVDQATAQDGIIHEQNILVGVLDLVNDEVIIYHNAAVSSPKLRRVPIGTLPSGVTEVSSAATPTGFNLVTTVPVPGEKHIAFSISAQGPNKVLVGPASGAGTTPSFRVLTPADVTPATVLPSLFNIDWSLGKVFAKVMPDNGTHHFSFSNVRNGQSIMVRVQQSGAVGASAVANWDNVDYWRAGGTPPVLTIGQNAKDIYFFTAIGSSVYGYSHQNFA